MFSLDGRILKISQKSYGIEHLLDEHKASDTTKRPYPRYVTNCSQSFKNKDVLAKHKRLVHREKRFLCNICLKSYVTERFLNAHKESHITERLYPCDEYNCNRSFKSENAVANHKRYMHREKRFVCNLCPKSYVTERLLNEHKESHITERPYLCDEYNCNRSFKSESAVASHKKYMHREKRFLCNLCPKSYVTKSLLDEHKESHTTERLYPCDEYNCNRSFKSESAVASHKRYMHREKRFACDTCDKKFVEDWKLQRHKKSCNK